MILSIISCGRINHPPSSIIYKIKIPTRVMVKAMVTADHRINSKKAVIERVI
jgi:hypothetical protein